MPGKSRRNSQLGLVLPGRGRRPRQKRPLGLQQASQEWYCPLQSGVIRGMSDYNNATNWDWSSETQEADTVLGLPRAGLRL